MITTSKASKRKGRESSLSVPPSTHALPLSASPGQLAGRSPGDTTCQEWLTARMKGGQFCGVPWVTWERVFIQLQYDMRRNNALDPKHLAEDLSMLMQHFPYDPAEWAHGRFACLERETDMNGLPPSIGIMHLPIDSFRRRSE
jgi:hypothetical protein